MLLFTVKNHFVGSTGSRLSGIVSSSRHVARTRGLAHLDLVNLLLTLNLDLVRDDFRRGPDIVGLFF